MEKTHCDMCGETPVMVKRGKVEITTGCGRTIMIQVSLTSERSLPSGDYCATCLGKLMTK